MLFSLPRCEMIPVGHFCTWSLCGEELIFWEHTMDRARGAAEAQQSLPQPPAGFTRDSLLEPHQRCNSSDSAAQIWLPKAQQPLDPHGLGGSTEDRHPPLQVSDHLSGNLFLEKNLSLCMSTPINGRINKEEPVYKVHLGGSNMSNLSDHWTGSL
jgi:hypothetical protein